MYAVIESGGKQHRVSAGETVRLEKLVQEAGQAVSFEKVLLVADGEQIKVGAPYVDGASVQAEVVQHGRGAKINVIKFKRRKKYRRKQGHRQDFTEVTIKDIVTK